ncbi:uncharacterized protein [Lolium perenne]|uniref:uncharacterized protein n=1 Tax=Lolium perenne TaxID=4522 RepID=UPI003A99A7FF
MKDMIDEIITSKATNEDFLRRAVLILIGTVLAPTSTYTVYKPFYAFVETMYKLHNLNWNQFTLAYVIEQISTCRRGIYVRQWPKGNVAILEYLYWEKVQPLDEIALYARISSRPLMINWTEAAVALRDSYDQDNGRGKGILKIEDTITEEYRRKYGKKTDGNKYMGAEIKKPGTGRSNGKGNGRSTGKASSSRKPGPSWEINMETTMKRIMQDFKREIMEELPERCAKDVVKLLNKSGVRYKAFAETLSDQYSTPSSNDVEIPQDSTALTAEHIAAAEIFVQLCCKTEENGKKCVYKNDIGVTLTSQRLKVVLDHKWCTDDVIDAYIGDLSLRVGDDLYLCAAWRSSFLLEKHRKGHKTKKSNKNDDHLAAYFPVNITNNHCITVIMHIPKEEFQVIDSLFPLSVTIDTVRALRQQISADIQEYNKSTSGFFPDVITWDIKSYDMPQQKDG